MMMLPDFLWGAASSAYQIEGALRGDGRGESIWDRFGRLPGRIADESSADPAADHYYRSREDVTLLRELGLSAYSFSISWPRIQPDGRGRPDGRGLAWYERLIDALLQAAIRPCVTLYHWDLPQAIQQRGGWSESDTVKRFLDYADSVCYRLGDRVVDWITIAEPYTVAYRGYVSGDHAPGIARPGQYARVAHNLLLAHGQAAPIVRGHAREGLTARVGIALPLWQVEPASERENDVVAAQTHDGVVNRWFLDAIFGGRYPDELREILAGETELEGLPVLADATDILHVVYGGRRTVAAPARELGTAATVLGLERSTVDSAFPEGAVEVLARCVSQYSVRSLYLTDLGCPLQDHPDRDGAIHDGQRIEFLRARMVSLREAVRAGLPLHGYFARSFLDGWEWERGYTQRYGIVYVDWATQMRTIKESGRWYARTIVGEGRFDD